MSVAMATLIIGAITAAVSAAVTVFVRRHGSPESQATMVTASTLLLAQLQQRIKVLEERLDDVERENHRHERVIAEYTKLYGPL